MLIGMILEEVSTNMGIVFIQSFAGGTFLYLAACDFLMHEFYSEHSVNDKSVNLGKFAMLAFGSAIVISLIALGPAHNH